VLVFGSICLGQYENIVLNICFYLPTCFSIQKRREELERLDKERQAELRSYKGLMVAENMTSNKEIASGSKSLQELEEDFM